MNSDDKTGMSNKETIQKLTTSPVARNDYSPTDLSDRSNEPTIQLLSTEIVNPESVESAATVSNSRKEIADDVNVDNDLGHDKDYDIERGLKKCRHTSGENKGSSNANLSDTEFHVMDTSDVTESVEETVEETDSSFVLLLSDETKMDVSDVSIDAVKTKEFELVSVQENLGKDAVSASPVLECKEFFVEDVDLVTAVDSLDKCLKHTDAEDDLPNGESSEPSRIFVVPEDLPTKSSGEYENDDASINAEIVLSSDEKQVSKSSGQCGIDDAGAFPIVGLPDKQDREANVTCGNADDMDVAEEIVSSERSATELTKKCDKANINTATSKEDVYVEIIDDPVEISDSELSPTNDTMTSRQPPTENQSRLKRSSSSTSGPDVKKTRLENVDTASGTIKGKDDGTLVLTKKVDV